MWIETALGNGASRIVLIFNRIYPCKQACVLRTTTTNLKTMQWESNMAKAWDREKKIMDLRGKRVRQPTAAAAIYVKKTFVCVLSCVICSIAPLRMWWIIK